MSYIAAAGAKERAKNYFGGFGQFDAFDTMASGLKSQSAKYVADTQYGAQRDYNQLMGETNLAGIKKVGGAQIGAANNALLGDAFGTIGTLAKGVSDFGVENDWFG